MVTDVCGYMKPNYLHSNQSNRLFTPIRVCMALSLQIMRCYLSQSYVAMATHIIVLKPAFALSPTWATYLFPQCV